MMTKITVDAPYRRWPMQIKCGNCGSCKLEAKTFVDQNGSMAIVIECSRCDHFDYWTFDIEATVEPWEPRKDDDDGDTVRDHLGGKEEG